MAVGKPHVGDDQVLAVLLRQAIGHTQPQGQRTIIGNAGHAQLATARFIPTAQHEELITAGVPPVPEPLRMTGVAILLQVMLLAPQPPGPEAQPHPARRNVGLQSNQPVSKIGQPTPLLVNLLPPALFLGLRNPPFPWSNSPLQAVHPQPLRRPHRRHLAFQRHPHPIEHPRRYPVLTHVLALQRRCRSARRYIGKQLALHLAVQRSVGCQRGISRRTSSTRSWSTLGAPGTGQGPVS